MADPHSSNPAQTCTSKKRLIMAQGQEVGSQRLAKLQKNCWDKLFSITLIKTTSWHVWLRMTSFWNWWTKSTETSLIIGSPHSHLGNQDNTCLTTENKQSNALHHSNIVYIRDQICGLHVKNIGERPCGGRTIVIGEWRMLVPTNFWGVSPTKTRPNQGGVRLKY